MALQDYVFIERVYLDLLNKVRSGQQNITECDIAFSLGVNPDQVLKVLEKLEKDGLIKSEIDERLGEKYFKIILKEPQGSELATKDEDFGFVISIIILPILILLILIL